MFECIKLCSVRLPKWRENNKFFFVLSLHLPIDSLNERQLASYCSSLAREKKTTLIYKIRQHCHLATISSHQLSEKRNTKKGKHARSSSTVIAKFTKNRKMSLLCPFWSLVINNNNILTKAKIQTLPARCFLFARYIRSAIVALLFYCAYFFLALFQLDINVKRGHFGAKNQFLHHKQIQLHLMQNCNSLRCIRKWTMDGKREATLFSSVNTVCIIVCMCSVDCTPSLKENKLRTNLKSKQKQTDRARELSCLLWTYR